MDKNKSWFTFGWLSCYPSSLIWTPTKHEKELSLKGKYNTQTPKISICMMWPAAYTLLKLQIRVVLSLRLLWCNIEQHWSDNHNCCRGDSKSIDLVNSLLLNKAIAARTGRGGIDGTDSPQNQLKDAQNGGNTHFPRWKSYRLKLE